MRLIICVSLVLSFTSCLKKIDGVDELNTNIFDKEYQGDCWFYIKSTTTFINQFGQTRVRVIGILPDANMPALKPSSIKIRYQVNEQSEILAAVPIDNKSNYTFIYDAVPETVNSYCLKAGIYLESEDSTINTCVICDEL